MPKFAVVLFFLLAVLFAAPTFAQEGIILSLQTAATDLQTGQEYEVEIRIDGAVDLWLATLEISYDPALIYVIGTRSGRPVRQGDFFSLAQSGFIRNAVGNSKLVYDVSMLSPADPVSGSGVVGTFRIYPLAAGAATLSFSRATLLKYDFVQTDEGVVGTNPQELPFTPALINLTITGDTVEPPSEATATPAPTETPTPEATLAGVIVTEEATLVNITLAPRTATPETPQTASTDGQSPLLPLALAVVGLSGLGLAILYFFWRRSQRK